MKIHTVFELCGETGISKSISSIAGRNILLLWNLVQGHPVKRNCPFKLGLRKYLLTMFKIFLIYVVNKVHIFLTLSWRRSQSHRNHGFYMIGTSIMKELMQKLKVCNCTLHLCLGIFKFSWECLRAAVLILSLSEVDFIPHRPNRYDYRSRKYCISQLLKDLDY